MFTPPPVGGLGRGFYAPGGVPVKPMNRGVDSPSMLKLDELTKAVGDGSIDTVIVAFTDMQGRMMGKRLHGEFFVEEHVGDHGVEGCNYLMALDMEMDPIPGYGIASWE